MANPGDRIRFGAFIRRARHAKGWTQPQLAEAAKLNLTTVKNVEIGRAIPIEGFIRLGAALGVRRSDLIAATGLSEWELIDDGRLPDPEPERPLTIPYCFGPYFSRSQIHPNWLRPATSEAA